MKPLYSRSNFYMEKDEENIAQFKTTNFAVR